MQICTGRIKSVLPGKTHFSPQGLLFHLLCQKRRCHCHCFLLSGVRGGGTVLGQQAHSTGHIPCRQDGADAQQGALRPLTGQQRLCRVPLAEVGLAAVHDLFQGLADAPVGQVPSACSAGRQDTVPVGDKCSQGKALVQHICILHRHIAHLPHRRILFEDDLAIPRGEDLQRVAPADALGTADLLGDHHPAQLVNASHDSGCFHTLYPPSGPCAARETSICQREGIIPCFFRCVLPPLPAGSSAQQSDLLSKGHKQNLPFPHLMAFVALSVPYPPVADYQTGLEICQPAVANGFFRLFKAKGRLVLPPCAAPAPSGKMEPISSTENISRKRW